MPTFMRFATASSTAAIGPAKYVLVNMDLIEQITVSTMAYQATLELRSAAAGTTSVYFGPADMAAPQVSERLDQLIEAVRAGGSAQPIFEPAA